MPDFKTTIGGAKQATPSQAPHATSVNKVATASPTARPTPSAKVNPMPMGPVDHPEMYEPELQDAGDTDTLTPELTPEQRYLTVGDSGTMRYGGYFHEDYEPKWADVYSRVELVEEMRRGDARVAQLLKAVKAPMLAAECTIECASDDAKDKDMVEFIKENLFSMKKRTFKQFFREMLTSLDFGFSAFEKIYEMRDGKIWLKDLAPRIQHSILKFQVQGGKRGITQIIRTDEAKVLYPEIPINKCVIFTNDKEGDDLTGISLLRYCYKHWYMKNNFYQIGAIGLERFAIGVPVITLPEGSGDADYTRAKDIVRNLRANQSSGIVLPNEKWKIEVLVPKGKPSGGSELKDNIDHHDLMILQAGLCAFLNLGTTDTGSFALSSDQHGFFLTYVQDRLSSYAEDINQQVINDLLEINGMVPSKPIKCRFTNIGEQDKGAMATWIKSLVDSGLVKVNSRLMKWVSDNFNLPEMSEEELEMMEIDEMMQAIPPDEMDGDSGMIDMESDVAAAEDDETDDELDVEEEDENLAEYTPPTLDQMIAEHRRLVKVLKKGDKEEIENEAKKQEAELQKYESANND